MKRCTMKGLLLCNVLFLLTVVNGQAPPKVYGVLPSAAQLKWHEMEMYCIVHFSMCTFNDKEWGFGNEDPALFNPARFDAGQIVRAAKDGGLKGVVVVAKHHDGFCLWPSKTTEHTISKSSWKNGEGDLVKEYKLACDRAGMKLGLYCSPWDRNSSWYGKPEYVTIYREQLKELYTNYGPLFVSWHDGANGGDGYYGGAREIRKIDRSGYYGWDSIWSLTRRMQPSAVIFGDVGPDVRWVGNEEGHAGETSWATYTPQAPDEGKLPSNGYSKYWEATEGTRNGNYWMPAECDVPLRPGWFYHAAQDEQVKSPEALLDLYYKSVGRGGCLDLGLAPDQQGLLPANDVHVLKQFGTLLSQTFTNNLAKGASIIASNIRGGNKSKYGPVHLLDNDRYSYWATDDEVLNPSLVIDLGKEKSFNVIRLRENIKLGQRIDSVGIDIWEKGAWKEIATATSIGASRLVRLPKNISTRKVRLRIERTAACIALSDFGLFKEPALNTGNDIGWKSGVVKAGWLIMSSMPGISDSILLKAIDGKPGTVTEIENVSSFPSDICIDMGSVQSIKAFTYLPRQDKKTTGIADKYSYYISDDGFSWRQVATGEFSNIKANPVEQITWLKSPVAARYYKFSILHVIDGYGISIAECGIR